MPLSKIKLRPGINRTSTDYDNEGGYFACDKIRFRYGAPEKIGGWVKYLNVPYVGTARALFNWVTLDNANLLALGTNVKYYIESSGGLYDVTPIRSTVTLGAAPLATTNGSKDIVVMHAAHGAVTGDYVTFTGATAVAGIPTGDLNREHTVTVLTASTYKITVVTAANATTTGGGSAISAAYQLTTATDVAVPGRGWNAGVWGRAGGWGVPASTSQVAFSTLRLWSQEAFGENHVFCPRDGQIYWWKYSLGLNHRATRLADEVGASQVPLMATKLLLSTQDRHLIAFGCNPIGSSTQDPLLIRWCDTENAVEWLPAITNAAGDLRISSGNKIVTAVRLKQEILVFTDSSLWSMQFIGAPDIFGIQPTADNISIISPNAAAVVGSAVYWMANDKFYMYNGRADTLPCTIDNYIFNDINLKQADQIIAGTNEGFSEVWWYYCSADSTTIDRYAIYNYDEKVWAYGNLSRTAWLDSPLKSSPIAASGGYLYRHEAGVDDDRTTPITAWIESSDFDLGDGDDFMFVKRLLPDISFTGSQSPTPAVYITMTPRNAPGAPYKSGDSNRVERSTTVPVEAYTERCDVRLRGRQMKIRIESNELGVQWQLGALRIETQPDGKK